MNFNYVSGDEREALYNEVWSEPMITVSKRYGMSDNGLRKHCKKLGIPLPTSGYWAKIKAGKNAAKAPLPEVYGILKRYVHSYVIKLKTDLKNLNDDELVIDKDLNLLSEDTVKYIEEKCSKIHVKNQLRNPHQLIVDHQEETIYRKKRDRELNKASFNSNYYATVKSKYRENEPILPIYVSDSNINRAYRIIDALINTLDDMEGRIQVTKEDGKDIGGFIILNTIFYFEIRDEIKKGKTKGEGNEPVRNLFITVKAQSWFDKSLNQNLQYKDTVDEPLELQLGKMVYQIFVIANRFRAIDELKHRKLERVWEEQERKQRIEQMRKGELKEVRSLEQVILDWDKAQKIKLFADSMEKALGQVNDEEKKQKIVKWIEWVRNKADWLEPLEAKYDDLLGKNKHIFDRIIDGDI